MKSLRRGLIALLATLATLMGVLACQTHSPAQGDEALTLEAAGLTLTEVADGVYGLLASTDFPPANPETDAICNGTIVIGDDGVLVVDPFQNEALADMMFATVAELTDQPVRYVVNTHYHFDHSGGNAAVAAKALPLVGRGPIRDFMLTRNGDMDPNVTPPEVVLQGPGELWLGDRAVQLVEVEGHSGGTDLVAYIPDVDVLIAGDMLFTQRIPYAADGNIRVWQDNLTQLASNYATATILPGHGPISGAAALETLRGYLEHLEAVALDWQGQNLSQEAAIAQATLPPEYGDYLFQGLHSINLGAAYEQITLGQDDAAAIQDFFQARTPAERAL
jgi:cyclase